MCRRSVLRLPEPRRLAPPNLRLPLTEHPSGYDTADKGRKGSVVGEQYREGMRQPRGGGAPPERPPTNEEVAKAVQQKVAVSDRQ